MCETELMQKAINIATENVTSVHGGPFGAIVVQNGKIISVGRNEVTATNDPTAHAEIQAIRAACQYLNSFQLDGCEIYTSCEPCPMCIGAIYWARPKAVYYASTKEDAAKVGFDDQFIYEELALPKDQRKICMEQILLDQNNLPFSLWKDSMAKTNY
ncbi:nucleoside deaminase [Robertmurraya sp. Marseille-Q9965]